MQKAKTVGSKTSKIRRLGGGPMDIETPTSVPVINRFANRVGFPPIAAPGANDVNVRMQQEGWIHGSGAKTWGGGEGLSRAFMLIVRKHIVPGRRARLQWMRFR